MLLDSTFLHDLVRDDSDATDELARLITASTPVAISALTVFEVGVGLRGAAAAYRDQFDAVLTDLDVVPLDTQAARRALAVQRSLYDDGSAIGAVDVLIAGTALERQDARVLTRNVDEFQRVDGLTVETY